VENGELMDRELYITRSSMPLMNEYIEEIKDIWDTKWLTNFGIKHKKLESLLLEYLNCDNISLFTNGHLALEAIIEALDLSGEVITTPFTFASTTHAIVRKGLTPVFCDIRTDDFTIDASKIESLVTDKTSAIIPVHVYGNICDVEAIDKIAKKYNLKVIYDAAHAFGVIRDEESIANYGDASMYSFHATKVFNTIEGGAVVYKDKNLKEKLRLIANFGIENTESVTLSGGNAKMNEFQAAMGICNLRYLDKEIGKRKAAFKRYNDRLSIFVNILLPYNPSNIHNVYSYYPILVDTNSIRDALYEFFKENNIYTRKYFYPLTSSYKCYNQTYNINDTPIAKDISERVLTLPLYADISLQEVDLVRETIKEFFEI
jgi:dTDP-4-amino-4,6-dideoxygalactose transaminase